MEILFIIVPLAILWLIFTTGGKSKFKTPEVSPASNIDLSAFEAAPSLFVNASESNLFHYLRHYIPQPFHVHSKVRLEDIIRVKKGLTKKARWAARGRVKSRHVDYVITDGTGRPMLAIELDGRAHNQKNPSEADKVKTALFKAAGLPLRRILVGEDFDLIAATIGAELNRS